MKSSYIRSDLILLLHVDLYIQSKCVTDVEVCIMCCLQNRGSKTRLKLVFNSYTARIRHLIYQAFSFKPFAHQIYISSWCRSLLWYHGWLIRSHEVHEGGGVLCQSPKRQRTESPYQCPVLPIYRPNRSSTICCTADLRRRLDLPLSICDAATVAYTL